MFCSNCGTALPDGAKFCGNCGTPVAEAAASEPSPAHAAYAAPAPIPAAWQDAVNASDADNATFHGEMPLHLRAPDLYAGFWLRFVSYFIDAFIVMIPLLILCIPVFAASGDDQAARAGSFLLFELVAVAGIWLYFALFERSHLQATPGKLALGLRVTDMQGQRIGFGRATGRYFGKILSGVILDIGYMMAGWTGRKQGLHDLMAGCLVVRRDGLARLQRGEEWPAGARAPGMPGWAVALVVLAICLFLIVPIFAAISIPAYQNYLVRTQVAEGTTLAEGAKIAIDEYYSNQGTFPRGNAAAGLSRPDAITGKYVSAVTVGTLRDGTGAIKVDFSDASNTALHGKYLLLEAHPAQDGSISWSCDDSTVAEKYLPTSCRDSSRSE